MFVDLDEKSLKEVWINWAVTIDNYLVNHYIHRSNWLRAAVLGANDRIISISSLTIYAPLHQMEFYPYGVTIIGLGYITISELSLMSREELPT